MRQKTNSPKKILIDVANVTKSFPTPNGRFDALKDISLRIDRNQFVAITGKSGSGKSTLLNILTGIDKPTRGRVDVMGVEVNRLNESRLAEWRGKNVGVVFQFFQLIPTLSVAENVMLPMDFCNTFPRKKRRDRALALLDQVGVIEQADKLPAALSGGQQQRVSIARALANEPPILIADEPTGNLDSQNAEMIFQLLAGLPGQGRTVIVVTHEKELAFHFQQSIMLADGAIISNGSVRQKQEARHASQV